MSSLGLGAQAPGHTAFWIGPAMSTALQGGWFTLASLLSFPAPPSTTAPDPGHLLAPSWLPATSHHQTLSCAPPDRLTSPAAAPSLPAASALPCRPSPRRREWVSGKQLLPLPWGWSPNGLPCLVTVLSSGPADLSAVIATSPTCHWSPQPSAQLVG